MANIFCGGLTTFRRLYVLLVLFGSTLCNQLEVKEISELVEDVENIYENHVLKRHDIVRRAAARLNASVSVVSPVASNSSTSAPSPTSQPSSMSPITTRSILNTQIRPSRTAIAFVKSTYARVTANIPTTSGATSKKPNTPTTKYKTTREGTNPTRKTTKTYPSTRKRVEDHHKYYTSHYYGSGRQWWFNLDDGSTKPQFHSELSKNIKFSDLFKTSFLFPYYGHLIGNVTITNKGYLFLGERLHVFNASAQYAAPLMADFGADLHEKTSIRYIDTGDRITVEWANMRLRNEAKDKEFSFQCSILKNGTLIFAYRKIPIPVNSLKDRKSEFFVRVGVSDTYRREKIKYGTRVINGKRYSAVRYIYYYLYDRVKLKLENVVDGSAYVLTPVPNCVTFNTCDMCLNTRTKFDCGWCSKLKRCSDGIDRYRVEWETSGCLQDRIKSCSSETSAITAGVIAAIVIVLLVVVLIVAWCVYAYTHPQTSSGLFLIRYGNPTKLFRNSSGTTNTSTDGRISFKTMAFESNS